MPPIASSVNPPLVHVDRDSCLQLERSMTREWLETDGRGGYASSTILLCPTRRYHGLLVAPVGPARKRHVFLSRFEESLHGGGKSISISMARYAGLWAPHGHQYLESFELAPWPSWTYLFGSARIEREVLLSRATAASLTRYRVSGQGSSVELRVRPLLPFREADALTFENMALDPRVERIAPRVARFAIGIRARPYAELPPVFVVVGGTPSAPPRFDVDPVWYRGLEYPADLARGYDGHEDQFSPGVFTIPLLPGADVFVAASLEAPIADASATWKAEADARTKSSSGFEASAARRARSAAAAELAADHFLVRNERGRPGIVAGYPWFGEWGRDTFIALPGLTLARGKSAECRSILEGVLPFLKDGLLPNVFGAGRADSDYGSADASLWFARAVKLCDQDVGGREIADRFLQPLLEIARSYSAGTQLSIVCDEGGLLRSGSQELNATWMDARVGGVPVTPRDGCAVEINALWYQLLAFLEEIHKRRGETSAAEEWGARKRAAGKSFLERFWIADLGYLADTWKDGVADRAMRPNMVIAAALDPSPLTRERRADVVDAAESELLTTCGLRTLEPRDPGYRGRFGGGAGERDRAYHQGAVWPWLSGFHCEAYLRAFGMQPPRVEHVRRILSAFDEQLSGAGLLHLSEVYDGDPPHRPGGTIAQAWNAGEILRAWRLLEEGPR